MKPTGMTRTHISRFGRALLVGGIGISVGGCAALGAAGPAGRGGFPAGLTLERDAWGVPVVTAPDDAGLAFGLAYAMAEDGLPVLEDLYAAAIGRASAFHGESRLASDLLHLALQTNVRTRAEYASLGTDQKAIVNAFAAGLNYYIRIHPSEVQQIAAYEAWMVMAFAHHTELAAPLLDALAGRAENEAMVWAVDRPSLPPLLLASGRESHPYEMHLRTADGWSFRGYGILGLAQPVEGIGTGVAYAHARMDMAPLLTRMRVDTMALASTAWTDTLQVNTQTGMTTRLVRSFRTSSGPVLALHGDTAIILNDTAFARRGWLAQLRAMSRAADEATFSAARSMSPLHAVTAMVDASDAVLFTPDGVRRVVEHGADGHAGDRRAAVDEILRPDTSWTPERLIAAAFDRRVFGADAEIAALVDEWEQAGARNPERAAALDAALDMLRGWDRLSRGRSETMTLYALYRREYEADSAGALPRFRALETVIARPGNFPLRPWETVNRIMSAPVPGDSTILALPVAGAPGRFGIMFAYDAERPGQHYVRFAEGGTGRGAAVVSRGQSSRPASRHSFDQAAYFATARLKPFVSAR